MEGRSGIESKFQPRYPHPQASVLLFVFFLILSSMSLALSFLADVILFIPDFLPILTASLFPSPLRALPPLPLQGQAFFFFPGPPLGGFAFMHRTERNMTGCWRGMKCIYVLPEENLSPVYPKELHGPAEAKPPRLLRLKTSLGWDGRRGERVDCLLKTST